MTGDVAHRWVTLSTGGRPVLFEVYADNTIHMVMAPGGLPPGAIHTLSFDECHEALYDRNGTLIVSREPG